MLASEEKIQYISCMGSGTYKVEISSIRSLTPDVHELALKIVDPPALEFQPGQAISINVPSSSADKPIRRYYSVSSPPSSSDRICLLFNQGERGVGSRFLRNHSVGQELEIEGPFGSFYLQDTPDRPLLFVATGTGIAPLRSMMATLLENGTTQPMTLLWGLRRECDVYFREEFEAWTVRYPQFSFMLTLSRAGPDWHGYKGRVTHYLNEMTHLERFAVYVCGGSKMVAEVTGLLRRRGVTFVYRERHHDEP